VSGRGETARAIVTCDRCAVIVSAPGLAVHQRSPACLAVAPLRVTPFQRACFAGLVAAYRAQPEPRGFVGAAALARAGPPGYAGVGPGPIARALAALELPCGDDRGGPVVTAWQGDGGAPWLGFAPRPVDRLGWGSREWVTSEGFLEANRGDA
jgi:hypothetical protein